MLDGHDGNVKMLIQGISRRYKGITFLTEPDNFDDICILSSENVSELITACAELADELIIDLSCACDARTRKVFETADRVLLVTESTVSAGVKLTQFISQNNVFESIKEKVTLVANKGAVINEPFVNSIISLPFVKSDDAVNVCKVLSEQVWV